MSATVLEAHGLRKRWGARAVLDGIDLTIGAGSTVAIVGRNGAGKSTLLRCLAGVAACDGELRWGGRAGRPPRGLVGFLPQSPRLPSEALLGEVTALFAALGGSAEAVMPDGVAPSVDPARRVGDLSGGEGQRAALAGLLRLRPRILLLDEPLADLDEVARTELLARLRRLAADGAAVVLTSPAPEGTALLALADRVLVLEGGRLADALAPAPAVP